MAKAAYGLQLFSIRDVSEKSLREALRQTAELGYSFVEFAGFFGNPAEDVAAWLKEYGLTCSGTHTGMGEIKPETIDATIAYHKAIGCTNLIVPGARWDTPEDMEKYIGRLNDAQKKLAAAGITLGYHNHSKEFFPTPYGKIAEDEIIKRTSVQLEFDIFWVCNAGLDPVALLEKYKDRVSVLHLKDGLIVPPENRNYQDAHNGAIGKALGEGQAPVKAVYDWALANNVAIVVESEGLDPTGPAEVGRCIRYLRSLEK